MAERLTVRLRDGRTGEVEAELRRYGHTGRTVAAAVVFGTALVLAVLSIAVPGLHFCAPWFLPLVGGGTAVYLMRREAVVHGVRGVCPACERDLEWSEGGTLGNDPLWIRCAKCNTPLELLDGAAT